MIDLGAIFSQLFSGFWWLLPLFLLVALLKSAWFKGVMGEAMVNLAARLFLDKYDDYLIKNVTIPFRELLYTYQNGNYTLRAQRRSY